MTIAEVSFTDNGDGTATMTYPSEAPIGVSFDIVDFGQGSVGLTLRGDTFAMIASGTAGDITYRYDIPVYEVEITEFSLSGPVAEELGTDLMADNDVSGLVRVEGSIGEMRVTEGELLDLGFEGAFTGLSYVFAFSVDDVVSTQSGTQAAGEFTASAMLPADGVAVLALPQALRDGLSVNVKGRGTGALSFQEVRAGEQVISSTRDSYELNEADISFGADGFRLDAAAENYNIEMADSAFMPIPVSAAIERIVASWNIPLLKSDGPLPFDLRIGLQGVSVADSLWNLIDPAGGLPRDPAAIGMGFSGNLMAMVDMLDFMGLAAAVDGGDVPVQLHDLALDELQVSAVGAELTGAGSFTFDNEDYLTFDGIPAPTGALDLRLVGGNGLLDRLIELGLVAEEEAMGARMMMGLFMRPGDGEDVLTSTIEIDGETGAVSANGQRLQ